MWGPADANIRGDLSMDRGAADPRSLRSPCTCGDVRFTHVERFQTLEDSLTNGENSLVYSSVLMCNALRHKPLLIMLLVFPSHTSIDS